MLKKRWRDWFVGLLPDRHTLAAHPWLLPIAARLLDRKLWRAQHESVARGVAVGTFWAFVIPFAQVFVAAAHCTWARANIPVAAAMTLVTNPLTIGPWLWLAYQLGSLVLGIPPERSGPQPDDALSWVASLGWPTVLGMGIFATCGALIGYLLVKLAWRIKVVAKRQSRHRAGAAVKRTGCQPLENKRKMTTH